jgi:hypothetical protein
MTYQAPDGWRLPPPRCPQHAAPLGGSAPVTIQVHRALRLFVTVGAWAAGLCLVVGSVALVAEAAGPRAAMRITAAAGGYPLHTSKLPGHGGQAGRDRASGGKMRAFAGTGNQTTGQFLVAAHSRWELQWSYTCATHSPGARLVIREGNAAGGGVSVAAMGAAGHGSTWSYSDTAAHYLVVLTSCAWSVEVVAHR